MSDSGEKSEEEGRQDAKAETERSSGVHTLAPHRRHTFAVSYRHRSTGLDALAGRHVERWRIEGEKDGERESCRWEEGASGWTHVSLSLDT